MKKKYKVAILILILLVLLTIICIYALYNRGDNTVDNQQGNSETGIDIKNYSLDYNAETDGRTYFEVEVTGSDYGYYYFSSSNDNSYKPLMYCDAETKTAIPLCNRPDCNHNDETCNAVFTDKGMDTLLRYYDGFLYLVGYDEEDYMNLYRVSLEGSGFEHYMKLYKADSTDPNDPNNEAKKSFTYPEIALHRDYVYYIDSKVQKPALCRKKLGSEEEEVIFQSEQDKARVYRMKFYGDYLLFQVMNVNEMGQSLGANLYFYNLKTGDMQVLEETIQRSYLVYEEEIYYISETGLNKMSLNSYEVTNLIGMNEQTYVDFYIGKNYICLYANGGIFDIYNHEGELIQQLNNRNVFRYYGGDSNYLFFGTNDGKHSMAVIDTKDIENNEVNWQYVEEIFTE